MFNQYPVNKDLDEYEVKLPNFWNKIYESGNPAWGKSPATVLSKFLEHFNGDSVLDLGCGEGRNSLFLASVGYKVTGIDISETAISIAKKKKSTANFLCASLIEDTWPDNTYDIIIDFGLFHFIPYEYRQSYIKNIYNHLNTNGIYCNQSGRLVPESPIVGKTYTPPQLTDKEILDDFADFEFVFLEEDMLPPHNGYGKYPCWNFIVKKTL
jgi:SAM-dependent methyltransferase